MINIEPRHLDMILSILKKYDQTFYIFGSRITEKARRFSDVDLFYVDDIPEKTIYSIQDDFEESDLPYTVDVVNYNRCQPYFQKIIKEKKELLYQNSHEKNNLKDPLST